MMFGFGGRTAALAQGDSDLARDWDLRVGFFIPERQSSRSAEGDVWFNIGVERAITDLPRGNTSISIDYYGAGKRFNVPIQFNVRGGSGGLRLGAGAGIGLGNDGQNGQTFFAYNLLVGYQLRGGTHPINVDLRYLGTGQGGGALNGWSFTASVRY
jgi:hypothetical protein